MRTLHLSLCLLTAALLAPGLASAQGYGDLTPSGLAQLAPQYRLEMPREQQSADGSSEELTIEERRAIQARLKLRRKMVGIHQAFDEVVLKILDTPGLVDENMSTAFVVQVGLL